MTQKEKENILAAYSAISAAVSGIEYYKRDYDIHNDIDGEDSLHSAKEFLSKILFKKKRK